MSIRLSPKHGLNPSMSTCFYCGGDKNELIIPGLMKGDREAPRKAVWNMEPCDQCKHFMEQGVILIEVDEAKTTDRKNPYRAGGWCVIKDEAIARVITDEAMREHVLKARVAFLPTEVWDHIGIERGQGTHPEGA
jgi:CRISPR/Cas system-associated protein Cas10 (large subunit of type III CRISPR-Cas system)